MNSSASWAKMVYLHHSFVHSFIHLCCITDITARPRPSRHAITGYWTALLAPCNNSWFRPHDNASGHSKIVTLRGGGQSQCHRVWQGKVGGRSLSRLRHAVFTQASDAELPLISFGLLYLIYQVVSFVGQCLYCMGFLEESCVVFWGRFWTVNRSPSIHPFQSSIPPIISHHLGGLGLHAGSVNPFKPSDANQLHFKVFGAILV